MKDKKKKNGFHLKALFSDRYTNFQKMWIAILLIVIAASLILTVVQIGKLAIRNQTSVQEPKRTKATASPSVQTDSIVLAGTEDAGKEYVNNTLFLGDSNTVRFMNEEDENGDTYTTKDNTIAVVGMGVNAIDTLKCMEFSTGTYTMVDSVKILQPQRIIITFGTNNLNGSDSESSRKTFIKTYTEQLKKIKEAYPSADLIVNSIPPISENTVYTKLSAEEIMHWNQAIEEMCKENKWHYLNSFEALADSSTGYALEGMMDPTDGLHLSDDGLKTLFEYIRTHASPAKDTRKKPLEEIPEIIGCKTDMITTNPLTGSGFTGNEGGSRNHYSSQQNNNNTYRNSNTTRNNAPATQSQTQNAPQVNNSQNQQSDNQSQQPPAQNTQPQQQPQSQGQAPATDQQTTTESNTGGTSQEGSGNENVTSEQAGGAGTEPSQENQAGQ